MSNDGKSDPIIDVSCEHEENNSLTPHTFYDGQYVVASDFTYSYMNNYVDIVGMLDTVKSRNISELLKVFTPEEVLTLKEDSITEEEKRKLNMMSSLIQ